MRLDEFAALFADRTRATICLALLDGRAWTMTELARLAKVAPSTVSDHVARLTAGGVLVGEKQGKHRYVRLAGAEMATLIEDLAAVCGMEVKPSSLREATRQDAEARARTCYDHLAGHLGVSVADAMVSRGLLSDEDGFTVTADGARWLAGLGIDVAKLRGRRPLAKCCLDWTERRFHLAGAVGAALCTTALDRGWIERFGSGRAVRVTPHGREAFREQLGLLP
jgi:DNA-binding transcriptional ArsR family regulator